MINLQKILGMKYSLIILLFTCFFSQAQINRFVYEYRYLPDSTRQDVKTEMMLLDIDGNGSTYYSRSKFVSDSIMKADFEKQIASRSNNISIKRTEGSGDVKYSVRKEYPSYRVLLSEQISMDRYRIVEDEVPQWKILPETQQIGPYKTQKAAADFGGRSWTAWFSADLPFQDGPYKFYGLPGLIVKIEDATLSHIMTLVGNHKVRNQNESTEFSLPKEAQQLGLNKQEIEISEAQFAKLWNDYLRDPSKDYREMMMKSSGGANMVVKVKSADGREISNISELYRSMEKRVQEKEKANNNRIEPQLYQK